MWRSLAASASCWSFLLLAGCQRSPAAQASALLYQERFGEAAEAAARWAASDPADPVAHLVLAASSYLGGRYDAFAAAREKAPSSPAALDRLAAFQVPPDERCPPALRAFLRGAVAEARGDPVQAAAAYEEAARAQPGQPLYRYSWASAKAGRAEVVGIPGDEPLAYAGLMRASGIGNWVPIPDEFTVSGGRLRTAVGECSATATFGGWAYLVSKDGRQVGWAPLLTRGEVILPAGPPPEPAGTPPADRLQASVEARFERLPFDFGNRYVLVRPGSPAGTAVPLILLPFAEKGPRAVLGTSVVVSVAELLPPTRRADGTFLALGDSVDSPKASVQADVHVPADPFFIAEIASVYHRAAGKPAFGAMTVEKGRMVFTGADLVRDVQKGRISGPDGR